MLVLGKHLNSFVADQSFKCQSMHCNVPAPISIERSWLHKELLAELMILVRVQYDCTFRKAVAA